MLLQFRVSNCYSVVSCRTDRLLEVFDDDAEGFDDLVLGRRHQHVRLVVLDGLLAQLLTPLETATIPMKFYNTYTYMYIYKY